MEMDLSCTRDKIEELTLALDIAKEELRTQRTQMGYKKKLATRGKAMLNAISCNLSRIACNIKEVSADIDRLNEELKDMSNKN